MDFDIAICPVRNDRRFPADEIVAVSTSASLEDRLLASRDWQLDSQLKTSNYSLPATVY